MKEEENRVAMMRHYEKEQEQKRVEHQKAYMKQQE